jgi:hypothetical protein
MYLKKTKSIVLLTCSAFAISALAIACTVREDNIIKGLAPIYAALSDINTITATTPKPFTNAGKIIQYGDKFTLQLETGTGVHIIDCADKMNPAKILFVQIPGVTEIAIKDNILLANNFNDLVSINIDSNNNVQVVGRLKNVYKNTSATVPAKSNTYFECVDSTKGVVVGWQEKTLTNPKCKTL